MYVAIEVFLLEKHGFRTLILDSEKINASERNFYDDTIDIYSYYIRKYSQR